MTTQYQHDWDMQSRYHVFPQPSGGLSADARKILEFVQEYDEKCQEARAVMIKKINELLGMGKSLK